MIKTLMGQVKQYKKASFGSILFAFLEVIVEMVVPLCMGKIIDDGISKGEMNKVVIYGIIMLVMVLMGLATGVLAGRCAAKASTGFACNVRQTMFEKIQTYAFANIDKFSTAGLVTRLTTDVTNLQNAYQMMIRICVRAPMTLICSLVMAIMVCPRMSWIFIAAILFLAVILFSIIRVVFPIFDKVFHGYDDLNASVQEDVVGIRVVKSFVREEYEVKKFNKAADKLCKMFTKAEGLLAFNNPAMMVTVYGCIILISWFGGHYIVDGIMTTGDLTMLFSYTMSILMSLMMLSMIFVMISMSVASAKRIAEVLNEKIELVNPENPINKVDSGSIDFDHVNFSYSKSEKQKKFVLTDVDLHISSGETIGIIGGTGSAKSSLVSLISRLYDVDSGEVKVGGIDVRKYDIETLRNEVSVVLQKNELFTGTILDNLRWGNENATEEECITACKMACADEFIQAFPDKYMTHIEQGGSNVSGGQKQRICIARALLKNPKILILDDSTSAVDTATDGLIRKSFKEDIPNITKLIISQRISSIKDADRILVLEDGRVNAFDTHEKLVENNEIYRSVYENQTSGSGDFDEKGGM